MNILQTELLKMGPGELDDYLAQGWFRMQQTIFTTHHIVFDNILYPAIWLRIDLRNFHEDKKYFQLRKRNSKFKTEIKKGFITSEQEVLFSCYKEHVPFETAYSLRWLLCGSKAYNVYNTYMINVYDTNTLIGTGFFDLGDNSAAGICSIYHPDYKRYSLGKFMIYQKMFAVKASGFRYFYPGYFVPGYPRFDYKLSIGKTAMEYFDVYEMEWLSIEELLSSGMAIV